MRYLIAPWVVIPTYNEIANIEAMIRRLFSLPVKNLSVLIVDDNSPDGTGNQVKILQPEFQQLHLISRPAKAGLGRAYVAGFKQALDNSATAIIQMDADFSHDPAAIPELLAELARHDLIIGSRYIKGISVINWPLKRLLLSMGANLYASLISGLPFKDTTGGFRAWRADSLRAISFSTLRADGYGWQIATLYRAWKKSLRIKEVPIIFTERREGQSKMSWAIVLESIWLVWKIRFLDHWDN